MKRYCKFLKDVKYGDEILFFKDQLYLITYEDSRAYYFGEHTLFTRDGKPYTTAIGKSYKGNLFEIEEDND